MHPKSRIRMLNGKTCFYGMIFCVLLAFILCVSVVLAGQNPAADALPSGGSVEAGSASIVQDGLKLDILDVADKTIINWDSFDIGSDAWTEFHQVSSSAEVLNRVWDADGSSILGRLTANGRVFIVNPAGVYIGCGAKINVAQLVASSLNISNADFLAGNHNFAGGDGSVINLGDISAEKVALIGKLVANKGTISCPSGSVIMAVGDEVYLSKPGSQVMVEISAPPSLPGVEPVEGSAVLNEGTVEVGDGMIVIAAAGDMYSQAVTNVGVLSASVDTGDAGQVKISAEDGTVINSGTIEATSADGAGGLVEVLGDKVGLTGDALVDVSGATDGGTALIGGDFQGKGDTLTASRTYVGSDAVIKADATDNGDGGKVIVWSDDTTRFYGNISAKGGINGGDGGFVEVSSKDTLSFRGYVDTLAPSGDAGTLLLDPINLTIIDGGAGTAEDDAQIADGIFLFGDAAAGTGEPGDVSEGTLEALVGNIILQATTDITMNLTSNSLDLAAGCTSLVMQAGENITINAGDTITTAGTTIIHLEADSPHTALGGDGTGTLTVGPLTSGGGAITLIGANFTISGAITAGAGNVTIAQSQSNQALGLGTIGGALLEDPELDLITTAGTLTIGQATTKGANGAGGGSVLTAGVITLDELTQGTKSITLISNSTINDDDDAGNAIATSGTLTLNAGGSIGNLGGAAGLNTDVGTLNATAAGAGIITITEADALTVSGLTTAGGAIQLVNAAAGAIATNGAITSGGGTVTISAWDGITLGANLTSAGGVVTLDADLNDAGAGPLDIGDGFTLSTAGADVDIIVGYSSDIILNTTGAIDAGTGDVTIAPSGAVAIGLGSGGTLNLTTAELENITAATLTVGNAVTTAITVGAEVSPDNVTNLHLINNSTVTATAGGIIVSGLAIEAGGAVEITEASTDVDTLAIDTSTGNVTFTDADGFSVGSVDSIEGVDTDAGSVALTATTGNITITNTAAPDGDVVATTTIAITALADGAKITIASGADVESTGGAHTYTADKMDIAGTITANNQTVTLKAESTGDAIDLGSTTDAAGNTLELSDTELDNITATTLVIGETGEAGAITVTADIDPANITNLHLINNSTVTGTDLSGGGIVVSGLAVEAAGAVTVTDVTTDVDTLAIDTSTGNIAFTDADGFSVGTVDSIGAVDTESGSVALIAISGDITVTNIAAAAKDIGATTTIALTAEDDEAMITIAAGANVESTGGAHTYIADKMDIAGTITATNQTVTLMAEHEDDDAINLGSATDAALNTLELSSAELDNIYATTLVIGETGQAGAITVSLDVTPTHITNLHLISDSTVTATAGGIVATGLVVEAAGDVTITDATTNVGTLAVDVSTGTITFTDADDFGVGTVDGITGIDTDSGNIALTATTSNVAVDADVEVSGNGTIAITAAGAVNIAQAADAAVTGVNGTIDITAGTSVLLGSAGNTGRIVTTGAGNIEITATTAFTMDDETGTIVSSGGTINIDPQTVTIDASGLLAVGDITVAAASLTTATLITIDGDVESTSGSVSITAANTWDDATGTSTITVNSDVIGDDVTINASTDHATTAANALINITATSANTEGGYNLDASATGGTGTITIGGALSGVDTITADADLINVNSTVTTNGSGAIDLHAGTTLDIAANISSAGLVDLDGDTNPISLGADITAVGNISINDNTVLDAASIITSTTGDVTFVGDISGAFALTVSASAGDVTFSDTVGVDAADVASLTVGALTAEFNGNVDSTGAVDLRDTQQVLVDVSTTITTTDAANGDIFFNAAGDLDAVTGDETLTLIAGDDIGLGTIGQTTPLAGLTVTTSADTGIVTINGDITVAGAINFDGSEDKNLAHDVSISSTAAGLIDLSSAAAGTLIGAYDLSVTNTSGNIDIGPTTVDSLVANANLGDLNILGVVTSTGLVDLDASALVNVAAAIDSTNGAVAINGGANVDIGADIDGDNVTVQAGTGDITTTAVLNNGRGGYDMTAGTTIDIGQNITAADFMTLQAGTDIEIATGLTLLSDTDLRITGAIDTEGAATITSTSGNVIIVNAITGSTPGVIILNAALDVSINNITSVTSLDVGASSATLNGGTITTAGTINFDDVGTTKLETDVTMTSGGSDIDLGTTFDNGHILTLIAGAGNVDLEAGNIDGLTVTTSATTDVTGAMVVDGDTSITSTGQINVSATGSITTTGIGTTTLTSTNGPIDIDGAVSSAGALSMATTVGGNITIDADVEALGNSTIDITAIGLINIAQAADAAITGAHGTMTLTSGGVINLGTDDPGGKVGQLMTMGTGLIDIDNTGALTMGTSAGTQIIGGGGVNVQGIASIANEVAGTNSDVTFQSAVTLVANTVVSGGATGDVLFNSTVDATTVNTETLTVNADDGTVTFNSTIGATTDPGALTVNAETLIFRNTVLVGGNIDINANYVKLGTNAGDIETTANDGYIDFGGKYTYIDQENEVDDVAFALTTDGDGYVVLGTVGWWESVDSLVVVTSAAQLNGDIYTHGADGVDLSAATDVYLYNNVTIGTSSEGTGSGVVNLDLTGEVVGNWSLTIDAGTTGTDGIVTLADMDIDALTVDNSYRTTITADNVVTVENDVIINADESVILEAGVVGTTQLVSTSGTITINADADGGGTGNAAFNADSSISANGDYGAIIVTGAAITFDELNAAATDGSGSVSLTATGAINTTDADAAIDITAGTIYLDAATGIGTGATGAIDTEVTGSTITAYTTGDAAHIDIDNTSTVDVESLIAETTGAGANITFDQAGGGSLTVTTATTASGNINITVAAGGDLTADYIEAGTDGGTGDGNIDLTTAGGGDIMTGRLVATNDTVDMTTTGAGAVTDKNGATDNVTARKLTIDNAVDIGASDNALNTTIANLELSNISGDTYILENDGLTLDDASDTMDGSVDIRAAGLFTVADGGGVLVAANKNITLAATGVGHNLVIDEDVTTSGTGKIDLSGGGNVTIALAAAATVTAGASNDEEPTIKVTGVDVTLGTEYDNEADIDDYYDGRIVTAAGGDVKIDASGAFLITAGDTEGTPTDTVNSGIASGGGIDIDPTTVTINGDGVLNAALSAVDWITVLATGAFTNNDIITVTGAGGYVEITAASIAQEGSISTATLADVGDGSEYVTLTATDATNGTITDTTSGATGITTETLNIRGATNVGASAGNGVLDTRVSYLNMSGVTGNSYITEYDGIELLDVSVGGDFIFNNGNNGLITATSVVTTDDEIQITGAASIAVGNINAGSSGTVDLDATTTITDIDNGTGVDITAGTIELNAVTGIGATGANAAIEVYGVGENDTVTATNTTSGGIFLNAIGTGGVGITAHAQTVGNIEIYGTEQVTLTDVDTDTLDVGNGGTILVDVTGADVIATEVDGEIDSGSDQTVVSLITRNSGNIIVTHVDGINPGTGAGNVSISAAGSVLTGTNNDAADVRADNTLTIAAGQWIGASGTDLLPNLNLVEVDAPTLVLTSGSNGIYIEDLHTTTGVSVTANSQSTGDIYMISNEAVTLTNIDTSNGSVTVTVTGDMITAVDIATGDDDVTLTAGTRIVVGLIDADAGTVGDGGRVSLWAQAGTILDDETGVDATIDIIAGDIVLTATAGIGDATYDALDTQVTGSTITASTTGASAHIDIDNYSEVAVELISATTTGTAANITFDQTGGGNLTVTKATTADGTIDISVDSGNLTAVVVTAVGTGRNVLLDTTTSGNILLGAVTAAGDTITVNSIEAIDDDEVSGVDVIDLTAATLNLDAVTGIGTTEAIETAATTIDADTTGNAAHIDIDNYLATATELASVAGDDEGVSTKGTNANITFDQFDGGELTLTSVTTVSGNIDVSSEKGNIIATTITAGTAGNVLIDTTISGNVTVGTTVGTTDGYIDIASMGAVTNNGTISTGAGHDNYIEITAADTVTNNSVITTVAGDSYIDITATDGLFNNAAATIETSGADSYIKITSADVVTNAAGATIIGTEGDGSWIEITATGDVTNAAGATIETNSKDSYITITTDGTVTNDSTIITYGAEDSDITITAGEGTDDDVEIGVADDATVEAYSSDITIVAGGDLLVGNAGTDMEGYIKTNRGTGDIKITVEGNVLIAATTEGEGSGDSKIDAGGWLDIDPVDVTINDDGLEADEYITITATGTVTNNTTIVTTDTDSFVEIEAGSIVQAGDITTPTGGDEYVSLIANGLNGENGTITDATSGTTNVTTTTLSMEAASGIGVASEDGRFDTDVDYLAAVSTNGDIIITEWGTGSKADVELRNVEAEHGSIVLECVNGGMTQTHGENNVITAGASTLTMIQAESIDLSIFTFTNQKNTDLMLYSSGTATGSGLDSGEGAVTVVDLAHADLYRNGAEGDGTYTDGRNYAGGKDENAADQWKSIQAKATKNIVLQGSDLVRDIVIGTNSGGNPFNAEHTFSYDGIIGVLTAAPYVISGTAQGSTDTDKITLASTASSIDNVYNGLEIEILDGEGVGQTRTISDYDGTTKVATLSAAWDTGDEPDSTSVYGLNSNSTGGGGVSVVKSTVGTIYTYGHTTLDYAMISGYSNTTISTNGTAQAGASTTITLASGASNQDDFYNGQQIQIIDGTGARQIRIILDYVGSTRVATVSAAWTTTPDATSDYETRYMDGVFLPHIDAGEVANQRAAIVLLSETEDLELGSNATLKANGTYNSYEVDDRDAINFLDNLSLAGEGKFPGDPIDVAIYVSSYNPSYATGIYNPVSQTGDDVIFNASVTTLAEGAAMVIDAYDTVTLGGNFTSAAGSSGFGTGNVLELCSRITETIQDAWNLGTLPYVDEYADGLLPSWFGGSNYVLRGGEKDAWILKFLDPAPIPPPRTFMPEDINDVEEDCNDLRCWAAKELGIEDTQVYVVDTLAQSTDVTHMQVCEIYAGLMELAEILNDVDRTRLSALTSVIDELSPTSEELTHEQVSKIVSVLMHHVGDGTRYAAAGEWLGAMSAYVNILNAELGWSNDRSIEFVMHKYGSKLMVGQDTKTALFVWMYLELN